MNRSRSATKTLILKGVLLPDEQMPSRALARHGALHQPQYGAEGLCGAGAAGILYTVRGRGNFVSGGKNLLEQKTDELASRLKALKHEAMDLGIDWKCVEERAGEVGKSC